MISNKSVVTQGPIHKKRTVSGFKPHYHYSCYHLCFLLGAASGAVFIKSFNAMSNAATVHPAVIDASMSQVIPTWR